MKGGDSRNQAVLQLFVGYALALLLFFLGILTRRLICGKYILWVLHGVALVNYNDSDTVA